ncbi:hypothetical protein CBL_04246 [Carabus blaptoides fortunei]
MLVIFISAVFFLSESHGYKIDTLTTGIKKDTENISPRYRRSSSTYVADENGQRVVIMTSSSPGFNSGLASTNFGSNKFDPIGGTGFNKPLGSIGGSTLVGSGGTLGGGGAAIGDSIGLGNTGFGNNGNRDIDYWEFRIYHYDLHPFLRVAVSEEVLQVVVDLQVKDLTRHWLVLC